MTSFPEESGAYNSGSGAGSFAGFAVSLAPASMDTYPPLPKSILITPAFVPSEYTKRFPRLVKPSAMSPNVEPFDIVTSQFLYPSSEYSSR